MIQTKTIQNSFKYSLLVFLLVIGFGFIGISQTQAQTYLCRCGTSGSVNPTPSYLDLISCAGPCSSTCAPQPGQCIISGGTPTPPSVSPPPPPPPSGSSARLSNPLGSRDIPEIIGNAIQVALGILGSVALALFIYGGLVWMTAGGSPDKVKKGRDVLVWATIGLVVVFLSYALLTFVFGVITGI